MFGARKYFPSKCRRPHAQSPTVAIAAGGSVGNCVNATVVDRGFIPAANRTRADRATVAVVVNKWEGVGSCVGATVGDGA